VGIVRGAKVEVKCLQCGIAFMARVADRKRGWAKFHSKSCKAKHQEARTGQYASYVARVFNGRQSNEESDWDGLELGWDAHKDTF
jgi:hypothetical protein